MVRHRKAEATTEPTPIGSAVDEVIQHAQDTMGGEIVNEPSQFAQQPEQQPTQPGQVEQAAAEQPAKKPFQVVRGWHTQKKKPEFRRLHDADLNIIVFKFNLPKDEDGKERMPADVKDILDAHKHYPETGDATGLHFENNRKFGKAWILPDDPAGRAIADKVAYALQKLAAKHELQAEQAAGR